jgi:hypothetical protein
MCFIWESFPFYSGCIYRIYLSILQYAHTVSFYSTSQCKRICAEHTLSNHMQSREESIVMKLCVCVDNTGVCEFVCVQFVCLKVCVCVSKHL